jgi:large repetitive protein
MNKFIFLQVFCRCVELAFKDCSTCQSKSIGGFIKAMTIKSFMKTNCYLILGMGVLYSACSKKSTKKIAEATPTPTEAPSILPLPTDQTTIIQGPTDAGTNTILPPATLSVLTPSVVAGGIVITNTSSLNISGVCLADHTVSLASVSGSSPTNPSMPCTDGTFALSTSETTDGTFPLSLIQTRNLDSMASEPFLMQWQRDTVAPSVPVVTIPSTASVTTTLPDFNLAGTCENGSTVILAGASTALQPCTNGGFSFDITKYANGLYVFEVSAQDGALNTSSVAIIQWTKNTPPPSSPTISLPIAQITQNNLNSIAINGSCVNGYTVNLTGASAQTQVCSAGGFSFSVSKTTDAEYDFNVNQTDPITEATSLNATRSWIRDTVAPSSPVVLNPATSPVITGNSSLTLTGECETASTVNLTGDSTQQTVCSLGTYSFSVPKPSDGTYNFSIAQTDVAGNVSTQTSQAWTRDTTQPANPTISAPSGAVALNNASSLTIVGTCTSGNVVDLDGDSTQSTTCTGNAFSFSVNKSSDNTYTFLISQTNTMTNKTSGTVSVTWTRDTIVPSSIVVNAPASNPYISADTNLTISGTCDSAETVYLTGANTLTTTCVSGAFSFPVSKTVDGAYNYSIRQKDSANNYSAFTNFTWNRDASIPSTPVVLSPSSSSIFSNASSLAISGTCTAGFDVFLDGDDAQTQVCSGANTFSFTVTKSTNAAFVFNIFQTNLAEVNSASATINWTRDTIAPSAVVISNPFSSPYTSPANLMLEGTCEDNATVLLSGDSVQSQLCENSQFNFTVSKSNGTYNFSLVQTDRAGNASSAANQQWVRDSSSVSPPVIQVPATSSYKSNANSITISGSCTNSYPVEIGGDIVAGDVTGGITTQVCVGSVFSFTVNKSADAIYAISLRQFNGTVWSSNAGIDWTRDTVGPNISVSLSPSISNLSSTAGFTFTSEAGALLQCSLNNAAFTNCSSPVSLNSLVNGSQNFQIKGTDALGNIGTVYSRTWTQAAYNTVVLYHFDNVAGTQDHGPYTTGGLFNNTLIATSTTQNTVDKKFGTSSRSFLRASAAEGFSSTHNASQELCRQTCTIEAWVRPTNTTYSRLDIASKYGLSGAYSWAFRLRKSGAFYGLNFTGSTNGTSNTLATYYPTTTEIAANATTWTHVAVTFNRGTVRFFINGVMRTPTQNIGTVGSSTLFNSQAPLKVGASALSSTNYAFLGQMDEVRISQVVRYTGNFTPSTVEFDPAN